MATGVHESVMSQNKKIKVILGGFSYNPSTGELFSDGQLVSPNLTPTEASVLEYLYSNSHRTVSREELLNHASSGRVVSPDIVTQYIRTLRKALNDSANDPRYIRTYQKVGYRFIASVQEIEPSRAANKGFNIGILSAAFVGILALVIFFQYRLHIANEPKLPVPITSLRGQEFDGNAAPSGKYIVFSHKKIGQAPWNLVVKKRGEESYFQLTDDQFNDRRARFSPSGNQILYHHYDRSLSQILLADVNWTDKRLENIRVVQEFPRKRLSIYFDWKDENNVFYTSAQKDGEPYHIAEINLETKAVTKLTEPSNNGHGDYGVAYSAAANKLIFLSGAGWSKTDVMMYDPETQSTNRLISLPILLHAVSWTSDGSGIYLRSGTGKVGLFSIEDGNLSDFHVGNSPVYAPFLVNDKELGFMRGDMVASDIVRHVIEGAGIEDNVPEDYIASSFHDTIPTFSQGKGAVAFISTRSGQKEIWLKSAQGHLKQVSRFKESPDILNLAIDDNAKFIAYTANAELHLMDVATGNLIFSSGEESGDRAHENPVFADGGDSILYSVKYEGRWQLEKRHLTDLKIRTVITEGFIGKPCDQSDCIYVVKYSDPVLYRWTPDGALESTGAEFGHVTFIDQLQIGDGKVYFTDKENGRRLLKRHDLKTNTRESLGPIRSARFSMDFAQKIAYWSKRAEKDTHLEVVPL